MKYKLTCNDAYQAMAREVVVVTANSVEEAFEKARAKFCRKHKTDPLWVDITGVEQA